MCEGVSRFSLYFCYIKSPNNTTKFLNVKVVLSEKEKYYSSLLTTWFDILKCLNALNGECKAIVC